MSHNLVQFTLILKRILSNCDIVLHNEIKIAFSQLGRHYANFSVHCILKIIINYEHAM